jgi:hypothetical protein
MHRIRPFLSVFAATVGGISLASVAFAADWTNIQDVAVSSTPIVVATTTTSVIPSAAEGTLSKEIPPLTTLGRDDNSTSTVILKMADGSFYHPSTGMKAPSEADLRLKLGLPPGDVVTAPPIPDVPPVPQVPQLLQAVYRAQQELKDRLHASGDDKIVNIKPVGQNSSRDITLAIWNRATDEIVYVDAAKKGTDLNLDDNAPVGVSVRYANYINSDYATDDPNHVVVAVRYPIYHEVFKGKKIVSYDVEQAVYTPASGPLITSEVVAHGEQMLDDDINAAITSLHKESTISPKLIKSIAIIEHSDTGTLKRDPNAATSKVFATIALNPTDPYAYARSSAGALGLFQFIPSTYKRLAKRTELHLNPNFEVGMSDPANASKAAVAYMDAVLGSLPDEAKADPTSARAFEFFAAAYNGGTAKIKHAAEIWDDQISGAVERKHILSRSRLQPETIDYVRKLRALLPVMMGRQVQPVQT